MQPDFPPNYEQQLPVHIVVPCALVEQMHLPVCPFVASQAPGGGGRVIMGGFGFFFGLACASTIVSFEPAEFAMMPSSDRLMLISSTKIEANILRIRLVLRLRGLTCTS
jgi:hypothetical protein